MSLPPLADILALFQDNNAGDISAADARSMITDLYNQIATNETDIAARLPLSGGTLTGDLITNTTITLAPTQRLRWRAQNTNFGEINADNNGFLIINSPGGLRISSPRTFFTPFDDDANIGNNLEIAADGEIIVGEDVQANFEAALAAHIGAATPPFQHVATDIQGFADVVQDAEDAAAAAAASAAAAATSETNAATSETNADASETDAEDAATRAEQAAERAEAAAAATAVAGFIVGETRWFVEDPNNPPTRDSMLRPIGQLVSQGDHPDLFTALNDGELASVTEAQWQAGRRGAFATQTDSTMLRMPDLRGYYVKIPLGDDPADSGRLEGTVQPSNNTQHNHPASQSAHSHGSGSLGTSGAGSHFHRSGLGYTGAPADTRYGSSILTSDPNSTRDDQGGVITATRHSVHSSTIESHTHPITGSTGSETPAITVSNEGLMHGNVRNVWIQPYIVVDAGDVTPLVNIPVQSHFGSQVERDLYFNQQVNFERLTQLFVCTHLDDDLQGIQFFAWGGPDNPSSYDAANWAQASLMVPPGSVFLGGIRISEGGNALVLSNASQNSQYLAQGIEFTDAGSVATNNVPVLGAVAQVADPQLVDTDTFTGTSLTFSLSAPSDFLLKEFDLRFNGAVTNITISIHSGTDNTGPQIGVIEFDATDGDNTITPDSNPRFVNGSNYFFEYSTTSAALNIRGDNSGMTFVPYFVTRAWPYSETTAVTSDNISTFGAGIDSDAIHDNVSGEINAVMAKATPADADVLLIEDSADTFSKKRISISDLPGGQDADAIHDDVAGEINAVTLKTPPSGDDVLLIEDSADSFNKKRITISDLPDDAFDDDAIHDNVANEISVITEKLNPVDNDVLLIEDSADSNNKKRISIGNLPGGGGGTGTDEDAIHDNVANEINAITTKSVINTDDIVLIEDSEDSFNKKKVTAGQLAGTTTTLAAANVTNNTANQNGLLLSADNQQEVNDRLDATGTGAGIVEFTGSFDCTTLNQNIWYGGIQTVHMQGASSLNNSRNTFTIPDPTELGLIFDDMVTRGVGQTYTLQISYIGGPSNQISRNALTIQAPAVSALFNPDEIPTTLARGSSVTLRISRVGGQIGTWEIVGTGGVAASGNVLNDIELQRTTWLNRNAAALPGIGQVQRGFAFRAAGSSPNDGTIRSDLSISIDRVLFDDDWVVWNADSFTTWADAENWFVLPANDVRRISATERNFLAHTSETDVPERGDSPITGDDPRFLLLDSPDDYDAADLNTNGQHPEFRQNTTAGNQYIAVRLNGTNATLTETLPLLWIVVTETDGSFNRILNLDTDFTFRGDFGGESDYVSDETITYEAGQVIGVYQYSDVPSFAISNYDATPNIPNLSIVEGQLSTDVQTKLNRQTGGDQRDEQRISALESLVDGLFPLTPDVPKLVDWGDALAPERTTTTIDIAEGYSLIADFRSDAVRFESSGVTYTAGTNVVRYAGLGTSQFRCFGFEVSGPANQTLLWIVDGANLIPYIDMTAAGNFRINNYREDTVQHDPVRNETHVLQLTAGNAVIDHTSNVATFTIPNFAAGSSDQSRIIQVGLDVLLNGSDTEAEHLQQVQLPVANTAASQEVFTATINLGPLNANREVTVQIGYTLRVPSTNLVVDFTLVSAESDVTIRLADVFAILNYTPGDTTTRVDEFEIFTDEGGDFTFTGENEFLVGFAPTLSTNVQEAVPVNITAAGVVTQLNNLSAPIPPHAFDSVEIPDTIEFRTFSPDHYMSHSALAHLVTRRATQWCYGLALLLEMSELSVTQLVDFTEDIVLTAPDDGRWRVSIQNDGTLVTTEIV